MPANYRPRDSHHSPKPRSHHTSSRHANGDGDDGDLPLDRPHQRRPYDSSPIVSFNTSPEDSGRSTPEHELMNISNRPSIFEAPTMESSHQGRHFRSSSDDDSSSVGSKSAVSSTGSVNSAQVALKSIVHATIPFYVQVLLLMMIPCTFLIAFASVSLSDASHSKSYVSSHSRLVTAAFECTSSMMVERGLMSLQVGYPVIHSDYNRTLTLLGPARVKVDGACRYVLELATQSSDEDIRVDYRQIIVQAMMDWEGFRSEAALRHLTPATDAHRWEAVEQINSVLAFLSRNKQARLTAKYFTLLLLARTMANSLGSMRAAGALYLIRNGTAPQALISHFNDLVGRYESAKANFVSFRSVTGTVWLDTFQYEPDIIRAWEMAAEVRQGNPLYLTVDPLEYFFLFTDALVSMHKLLLVPDGLLEKATSGQQERKQLVSYALQLVFALLCSGAAATFLVIRQKKNVAEMAKALDQAKVMNAGVRRYVPKRFLALMGSTSILQLHVGDFTEVAVTMLFSDIRSFTDISCTLSNSALFSWLSNYLVRMTAVTEKHHGFVDKFIGDAIFSVFTQPKNGVSCAIEMQILADELSLEVVGKQNKTDIVRIGVGVHHGIVAAGILGDESRHTATLISSDVNLASRLEGLTKHFGARILVSAIVADQLSPKEFCFRRLGKVRAKGHTETLEIYEVFQADPLLLKEQKRLTKDRFEQAVAMAEQNDIDGAMAILESLQRDSIDDSKESSTTSHKSAFLSSTTGGVGSSTTDGSVQVLMSKMDGSGCIVFHEK